MGYTVTVERGYVVNYSMQLVECDHDHTHEEASILDDLNLLPATASAGHGGDGPDPSAIEVGIVESIGAPELTSLGTVETSDLITYCGGHYLIAAGRDHLRDMPADVDMNGISLYVDGFYTAPGASQAILFSGADDLRQWQPWPAQRGLCR